MRIVHLIAQLKEENKLLMNLEPMDMDDDQQKFCDEAEYILGTKKLMKAIIKLRGQEFTVIYNPLTKMPPALHTPDNIVLYGDALIGSEYGGGMVAGLSGGGEKLLYQHLKENMQETLDLLAAQQTEAK